MQLFVTSEVNGTWGKAKEIPAAGKLAHAASLSCGSAGNCSVAGYYTDTSSHHQAIVVNQVNGTWGKAQEIPGTASLNTGNAQANSVSCPSAGNCSAAGSYTAGSGNLQAFVASRVSGKWGKAQEIPAPATSITG